MTYLIHLHDEDCDDLAASTWKVEDADEVENILLESDVTMSRADRVRAWCDSAQPGSLTKTQCEYGQFFIIRLT